MSRLDNYYESINALAARQPEQFIHASEERYRNIIRRGGGAGRVVGCGFHYPARRAKRFR